MARKKYKFLTNSEQAVLDCYLDGMSQQDTASYLQLSLSAIKHHTKSLHIKYNVPTTLMLVCNYYKTLLNKDF